MTIVILMRFESRLGLEFIRSFLASGIKIEAVFIERDPSVDIKTKEYVQKRTAGYLDELNMASALNNRFIPSFFVKSLNDPCVADYIKKHSYGIGILGGCGIIKKHLIDSFQKGVINCHSGKLPFYRGCTNLEWAIYNDDEVYSTMHFVDEKIDHGPIILQKRLPIVRGMTYEEIRASLYSFNSKITLEALRLLSSNNFMIKQKNNKLEPETPSYKVIPDDKLNEVIEKLKKGKYLGYTDN
jgi:methionyl-tRNA formyltransferase